MSSTCCSDDKAHGWLVAPSLHEQTDMVCVQVFEKTFAAAASGGRPVLYVTERAVFRLCPGDGIELVEVAPGIDAEAQVLSQMYFRPIIRDVKTMDVQVFQP